MEPVKPSEEDCCGSGCARCVFDIYQERLAEWERRKEGTLAARASEQPRCLSELRYSDFRVTEIADDALHAKVFTFASEDGGETGLRATQHVIACATLSDGEKVSRAYTPIAHSRNRFDVLIKFYDRGKMSGHFGRLSVGDAVKFRGPYGGVAYRPGGQRRVVMFAAGTGVAPMYSLASSVVRDERDDTVLRLLLCVRTLQETPLRRQTSELRRYWNFTAQVRVSDKERTERATLYDEDVVFERLDERAVRSELGDSVEDTLVLVCGTESFNKDIAKFVVRCGVVDSNVHVF